MANFEKRQVVGNNTIVDVVFDGIEKYVVHDSETNQNSIMSCDIFDSKYKLGSPCFILNKETGKYEDSTFNKIKENDYFCIDYFFDKKCIGYVAADNAYFRGGEWHVTVVVNETMPMVLV